MLKGFKVTNTARTKIIGIGCSSLKELKYKACLKFKIGNPGDFYFLLLDGTIVDTEEYFHTLTSQTLLVLTKATDNVLTGTDIIYNALKSINIEFLRTGDIAKQFFDENVKEKMRILAELVIKRGDAEDNCMKSSRIDDPKWFEGLETTCSTKEKFLRRRCKDRINGYFYKTKNDLSKFRIDPKERKVIEEMVIKLKEKLLKCDYKGGYFDREDSIRLCDRYGYFNCSGVWNKKKCLYLESKRHIINPYSSREERIVFSTWNLDHRIEKSRTIIPCIEEAIKLVSRDARSYQLNHGLIFSLLFTTENLRLVHVVCHDKGAHSTATLEPDRLLIKQYNGIKNSTNT